MHGEDLSKNLSKNYDLETPPYARGRHPTTCSTARPSRNTPVCTGKTLQRAPDRFGAEKHPRMHGEDKTSR